MTNFVDKLAVVCREQLKLYNRVLELAEEERGALLRCRPLGEIIPSLEEKRSLLRTIETMGTAVAGEKTHYERNKHMLDAGLTGELNETIRTIKQTINRIMEIERLNEQTILSLGNSPGAAATVAAAEGGANDGGQGYAG